jgi:hypothetical protein
MKQDRYLELLFQGSVKEVVKRLGCSGEKYKREIANGLM